MRKIYFILCMSMFSNLVCAQSAAIIDSFQRELRKPMPDTAKVWLLRDMAIEYEQTNKKRANEIALEALKIAQKEDFIEGMASVYMVLGNISNYDDNFMKALDYYQKGVTYAQKAQNKKLEARINYRIGYLYTNYAIYDKAIVHFQKVLDFYEKSNNKKPDSFIIMTINMMGTVFTNNRQCLQAIIYHKKALKMAQELKDHEMEAIILNDLNSTYGHYAGDSQNAGDKQIKAYEDSSYQCLMKAYEILETYEHTLKEKNIIAVVKHNVGNEYYDAGEIEKAKNLLQESITLSDELSLSTLQAYNYTLLANIYWKEKNYAEAERVLKKALENAEKDQTPESFSITYDYFAQFYIETKQFEKANGYLLKYISIQDTIYNIERTNTLNNLQIKYETEKKEQQIQSLEKENTLKQKINYALILLSIICLIALFSAYYNFRLKRKVFAQREQLLAEEKQKAILAQKLEENAKKDALLKLALQAKEQERLQQEIDFKHRELTANMLQIEQKNEFLLTLKAQLQNLDTKGNTELKSTYKLIDESVEIDEDIEKFIRHFEQVHPDFFVKLQDIATTKLSSLDMKYCAYMRMQMNTKDIAQMLSIEPKSIRMARYRLKKKLKLTEEVDLIDFIAKL